MGVCKSRLTAKNLAFSRLTVDFFQSRLTEQISEIFENKTPKTILFHRICTFLVYLTCFLLVDKEDIIVWKPDNVF